MDQDELLAKCHALAVACDLETLAPLARALEQYYPRSENQWRKLYEIFGALKEKAWIEIMTERFLALAPQNTAARIAEAKYISEVPLRRAVAIEKVNALAKLDIVSAEDCLTVGLIYANCALREPAIAFLERALMRASNDGSDSTDIRIKFIQCLITFKEHYRAHIELDALIAATSGQKSVLITATMLALRLNDKDLAIKYLDAAMAVVNSWEHIFLGTLLILSANLGRLDYVERIVAAIDYGRIRSLSTLEEIYEAVKGRGFHQAENAITATVIAREPHHPKFYRPVSIYGTKFPIQSDPVTTSDYSELHTPSARRVIQWMYRLVARR